MDGAKWDRRDWAAVAFLMAAVLAFLWPLMTPDAKHRRSYPAGDFYDQFHAFASYKHDRLWAGEIPLWNPYTFGGHPFLADVQAAVFYPISLLVILLSGRGPFSPWWLEIEAIVHYGLAALFTYLLFRRLTTRMGGGVPSPPSDRHRTRPQRTAAILSALAFTLGGYLTSYPPLQLAILETQVWLPLILLLLDIGLTERRWGAVVGAGVAWGMALLAGHPQSAMYVFYCALPYGVFRSLTGRGMPPAQGLWPRVRWFAIAHLTWIGIGAALAAVHLLPAAEFMRLSVRASATYDELAGGLGWGDLAQYVLPGTVTHWSPVYVGLLPLVLALAACIVWVARRGRSKGAEPTVDPGGVLFWAALALLSLTLALGRNTPLYRLFYLAVPGFDLFRSQERAIYLTSFAVAVLAGYGWCDLWSLLGSRLRPRWQWTTAAVAVGLVWVDLWCANGAINLVPGRAEDQLYDTSWLRSALADGGSVGEEYSPPPIRLVRVANEWGLPGNYGCVLGVQDLYGASPLRLEAHKTMADTVPHWRLWQLFGVRYVVTWERDLPGPVAAHRVAMLGQEWAKNTVYVHRLEADSPRMGGGVPSPPSDRAWLVGQARRVTDAEALTILADPAFDPYAEVLLAEAASEAEIAQVADAKGQVWRANPGAVQVEYKPERISVQAALSAPGWLVMGEWSYPGWQVFVDGRRQTVYRADYALRAVPLAAGTHQVVFRYRPASFYLGSAVSAVALLLCAGALVARRVRHTGER